jgi:mannose/fructose/N-acetylgalactosamine-specific phosphotransferase system component IID
MGHGERIKMEILHIVGSAASILGLLVALFVAQKVLKIDNSISVKGDRNLTAGRDLLHK